MRPRWRRCFRPRRRPCVSCPVVTGRTATSWRACVGARSLATAARGWQEAAMKLAIFGATGRMGQAVTRLAHEAPDVQIVGALAAPTDPALGRDVGEVAGIGAVGVAVTADLASGLLGADVVIDFSIAAAVPPLFAAFERAGVPNGQGTTNFDARAPA